MKTTKFHSYGGNLDKAILRDAQTMLARLNDPPIDKKKLYAEIKTLMAGTFSPSQYNELAIGAPELEDGIGEHSGFSFSCVLWAIASFINGFSIDCGIDRFHADGTITAQYK